MEQNRPHNYRAQNFGARPLPPQTGQYQRRPIQRAASRQVDGFTASVPVNNDIVPASQSEYIASLAPAAPRSRAPQSGQADAAGSNIFGINTLTSVRQRFAQVRHLVPITIIALIMIGSIAGLVSWRSERSAGAERSGVRNNIEITEEDSELTEKRPTDIFNYQVAPELPRFIRFKGLGLTSRVRRVGVGENTALRLPANIYDAGWYEGSVKPGEDGAVVLTGHSMGPTKPGIFADLQQMKAGDKIELETGDGRTFSYYVVKLEAFNADEPLEPLLASAVPGSPGLNLITESGAFDENTNMFSERLVLYAVQDGVSELPATTQQSQTQSVTQGQPIPQ